MTSTQRPPVRRIAFPILIALSASHCLNDLLQSVITAVYPLFKQDLSLSFAQIGLITLVYQMSASVFQPIMGLIFDRRPIAWSLPLGMCFTLAGILNLSFATNLYWLLASVLWWASAPPYCIPKRRALLFWLPEASAGWRSRSFRWAVIWEAR